MKHNLGDALQTAHQAASGTALFVPGVGALLAWGTSVPADAATGYGTGCIFIHTDATDQSDLLYGNIGDTDSANFNLITVAGD